MTICASMVFRGNFIVPVCNPFQCTSSSKEAGASKTPPSAIPNGIIELCPGLEIRLDHLMETSPSGIITHFEHGTTSDSARILSTRPPDSITQLSPLEFLSPGFIDLHIHAAQYSYAGTATDLPLMNWLEEYTFPAERSLGSDPILAKQIYEKVVRATVRAGTTTALYFGTLHLEPNKILCQEVMRTGQRALVGKVCMDRNCPEDYCHSVERNVEESRELIDYILALDGGRGLIMPVVTPRFIPTCSPNLMRQLASLANEYGCHIQSHISESVDEVEFSSQVDCEDRDSDEKRTGAEIFDGYGLLTEKTVMAHGVFLSDTDADRMKHRGCAIAHCPLSNFYFAGTPLRTRHFMSKSLNIGLGSDVAGGYSPSIMNSARNAVLASRSLWQCQHMASLPKDDLLDYRHAFYLATLGGAEALGLQDEIGTFRVGMKFDAVVLSAESDVGNIDVFGTDRVQDVFQKICCLGDDRNVRRVFVQGREVK